MGYLSQRKHSSRPRAKTLPSRSAVTTPIASTSPNSVPTTSNSVPKRPIIGSPKHGPLIPKTPATQLVKKSPTPSKKHRKVRVPTLPKSPVTRALKRVPSPSNKRRKVTERASKSKRKRSLAAAVSEATNVSSPKQAPPVIPVDNFTHTASVPVPNVQSPKTPVNNERTEPDAYTTIPASLPIQNDWEAFCNAKETEAATEQQIANAKSLKAYHVRKLVEILSPALDGIGSFDRQCVAFRSMLHDPKIAMHTAAIGFDVEDISFKNQCFDQLKKIYQRTQDETTKTQNETQ